MKTTWYLVANGSSARLLELDSENRKLRERARMESFRSRRPRHTLTRDRPGLYRHGSGPQGAFGDSDDPKRREAEAFMRTVASQFGRQLATQDCDRLIVAAPAGLCEVLHDHLPPVPRERVAALLHKDYVRMSEKELYHKIRSALLPARANIQ
jgi:hypothetical protein